MAALKFRQDEQNHEFAANQVGLGPHQNRLQPALGLSRLLPVVGWVGRAVGWPGRGVEALRGLGAAEGAASTASDSSPAAADTADAAQAAVHNWFKGERLAKRDDATRRAIAALDGMVDVAAVTAAWAAALVAPVWDGPGVWVHGDLLETNLLARHGRLSAVIDFGCLVVGDPACDVMTAWAYLPVESRDMFRAALSVDDATWARGRGWALSWALIALTYYKDTNPEFAPMARRTIAAVLADHTQASGEPA